jgi:oxygen-independent coproporphyrinogen-3 oxidase
LKNREIGTVFIGGGTPSIVEAEYIGRVMEACRKQFFILPQAEISLEANPGTLNRDKLDKYRRYGINRLSMGLQAWQDRLLKMLGRIHSADQFVENYYVARKAGFTNINIDLIFGLPGQNLEDWTETLENVLQLKPEHISCYSLKIEEGTVFDQMLRGGQIKQIDDEVDREMYYKAIKLLGDNGYTHYEISNFAREGFQCRHNLVYWNAEEYLGLGAGAHSYLDGKRFSNITNVDGYNSCISDGNSSVEDEQFIDREESMSEYMILGLRLTAGVSDRNFKRRYGESMFERFCSNIKKVETRGLIEQKEDTIRLTKKGLDLANQVFVEFI